MFFFTIFHGILLLLLLLLFDKAESIITDLLQLASGRCRSGRLSEFVQVKRIMLRLLLSRR